MRRSSLALCAVILLAGCHADSRSDGSGSDRQAPAPNVEKLKAAVETPKDPAEKLREQIRSAAVQLNPAVDKIQEAYEAAKEVQKSPYVSKEVKQALDDAISSITEAGSNLSNFTEEPPEISVVKKDLAKFQKQREAIIIACNDAIHDLTDAESTLDDVAGGASPKLQNPLEGVTGLIDEALGTVRDALSEAGGKEEKLDDVPDSTDSGKLQGK